MEQEQSNDIGQHRKLAQHHPTALLEGTRTVPRAQAHDARVQAAASNAIHTRKVCDEAGDQLLGLERHLKLDLVRYIGLHR